LDRSALQLCAIPASLSPAFADLLQFPKRSHEARAKAG
jgi:hypothetical protein